MPITIKIEPQEFQSTYNEVMLVLDSTEKASIKFQYVVDIYLKGVYSSRLKIQSNPDGYGVVNLSKHLETAITSDLPTFDVNEAFTYIPKSFAEYSVVLSEEYVVETAYPTVTNNGGNAQFNFAENHGFNLGDNINITGVTNDIYDGFQTVIEVVSPSVLVTSKSYIATSLGHARLSSEVPSIIEDVSAVFSEKKYATNNVLDFVDVNSWNASDYTMGEGLAGKFLTNLPTTYYSRLDDVITMNFRQDVDDISTHLKVVTNLGTYYFNNQHVSAASTKEFLSVGVGVADLTEDALAPVGGNGTFPMFNDASTSYTVQLVDTDYINVSEVRTFIIDRECSKRENTKLLYLNRGGSFSPFNFAGGFEKGVKVSKKTYQQNYGGYNPATNTYGWLSSDRGTKILSTDVKESYTLNTVWLPEIVGNTIADLIISPEVYKIESDGSLRAVNVITSSVKLKKSSIKKLISYSLDIEYSANNSTQN